MQRLLESVTLKLLITKTMTTKEELEQLKKQFATLEAKIANEQKQEIKTCEDAWKKLMPKWYINDSGSVTKHLAIEQGIFLNNQCNMTSEKEAKRIKALIQLRLIAEAMNEGVERECKSEYSYVSRRFTIEQSQLETSWSYVFPVFNTKELARQALTNFKPLFEDLYAS
jgi:hypothetical protein